MRAVLLFIALAALPAAAGTAEDQKQAGVAVLVSGGVRLRRPYAEGRPLAVNDALYLGDAVETGPGSLATLVLLYGSEVRMNENTLLEFIHGDGRRDGVSLKRGQMWTRLLHKMGGLDVRTRTAVCAVRGTEADLAQARELTVKVYEGHVEVTTPAGKVSLSAGQMARAGAGAPRGPWTLLPRARGAWQERAVPPNALRALEKLREASGGEELELTVRGSDGTAKGVRIKLKRKEAGR